MQIDQIFPIIIFIFSVIIHEVAHGYAAYMQGDNTAKFAGRLTLNPIPHIDIFGSILLPLTLILSNSGFVVGWAKPVPFNPYNLRSEIFGQKWGEAVVAIAGPLSNITIAVIFSFLIRLNTFPGLLDPFAYIVLINLVLALFNLMPIPPLDGSKILFSLLPYRMNYVREFLEKNQIYFIIFFVFFVWKYVFPLVYLIFGMLTGLSL